MKHSISNSITIVLLICSFFSVKAQTPINDDCVNAITLTPNSTCSYTSGTLNGALTSMTTTCGSTGDVFFKFTALSTGNRIELNPVSGDLNFTVLDGSCTGSVIACVNNNGSGIDEVYYSNNFIQGNTYYVRVSGNTNYSTTGNFQLCVMNIPPAINDDCVNAITLTPNSTCSYTSGTLNGALTSMTTTCGSTGDVFYKFTALSTGNRIELNPVSGDLNFTVLDGSCTGSIIACVNNNGSGIDEVYYSNNFIQGNTYYVRVSGNTNYSTTGNFQLCVMNIPPAINDDCVNAITLTPNSTCNYTLGTLNGALTSMTTTCGSTGDVFYKFTALSTGNRIELNPVSGDLNFTVLDGSCTGSVIACVNNNGSGIDEVYYSNNFIQGNTYYVRVSGNTNYSTTGNFQLCVMNIPPAINDDCVNAITLTPNSTCSYTSGTLNGALTSMTTTCGSTGDVFYKFTALSTGNRVTVDPINSIDINYAILDGNCTNTVIACRNSLSTTASAETFTYNLTIGNVYLVRVSANTNLSVSGDFNICIQSLTPLAPVAQYSVSKTQLCEGTCVNYMDISTNSPTSWLWQFNGAGVTTSTLQSPTNICYSTPGVYSTTLVVTNTVGSTSSVKTITVVAKPIVTSSINTPNICNGSNVNIINSGAITYTLYPNNINTTNSFVINPVSTSSYSVFGSSMLDCISNSPYIFSITVNPTPTISVVSSNTLLCVGQTASLTANGANSYTWSNTSTNESIVITPSITTTYNLFGTNSNNCSSVNFFTQQVSTCTDITNNTTTLLFKCYPNPTESALNIEASFEITFIQITDAIGQLVYSSRIKNKPYHLLDIDNLKAGIYFIKVDGLNNHVIHKIIKQ